MTTVGDLQALVGARYAGLDLPHWPDPHADVPPRDEEYSRLTDPERYRIVHERVRIWVGVLEETLGARAERLDGQFDRGLRLVSLNPDALPLVILERDEPHAAVEVAVGRPDVLVSAEPDCGCDACDSGSDHLLGSIDLTIARVVGGPFVVLRGQGWQSAWHRDGASAGSDGRPAPEFDTLIDISKRLAAGDEVDLPADTEALVGQGWLG